MRHVGPFATIDAVYPAPHVLEEVGRVTICGSRVDLQLAYLVHHLDPQGHPFDAKLRRTSGGELISKARSLADKRLQGLMQQAVARALDDAQGVREERHDVVHQEWVLRGADAFPTPEDLGGLTPDELEAFHNAWQHAGRLSPDWLRLPARSVDLEPAHTLDHLRDLERRLGGMAARLLSLVFAVASSRECGKPEGYVHPASGGSP